MGIKFRLGQDMKVEAVPVTINCVRKATGKKHVNQGMHSRGTQNENGQNQKEITR